jgi:hypothetical protein
MSKVLKTAAPAILACGLLALGGTGVAGAQSAAPMAKTVKVTGAAKNGKKFNGKYTISRFISRGGKLYSVGTLTGRVGGRKVTKHGVRMPAGVGKQAATAGVSQAPPLPLPPLPAGTACSILSLDLGPVNLNVLGLVVRTNQIQLRIDAVQAGGNLLGNLLCSVANLLNPGQTAAGQLAQLLNAILGILTPTGG